ncbi:hypothetical protein D3C78_393060 [compost metagenome]
MHSTSRGSWMRVTMVCEARSSSTMPIHITSAVSFMTPSTRFSQPGNATRVAIGRTIQRKSCKKLSPSERLARRTVNGTASTPARTISVKYAAA